MDKNFYITTTLPYVNSDPHLGFALEIIHADIVARYFRLRGYNVVFNTGTDEHGLKIYRKAIEQGKSPQAYVDEYAAKFDALRSALNLSYTHFIRTTDSKHKAAAQEFWRRCEKNGDIYKKAYSVKYCVGCELEKTDSELLEGKCPVHPNLNIETIEEENYFFRFSKYQQPLLDLYKNRPDFVLPDFRMNEIKKFVESGLHDFSISRLKEKMPWGVPVPGDDAQVMYVWFDALVNYISTLGWPNDEVNFAAFWPGSQVAGKDNLRQQSAMWQAMLMSSGLPPSKQIAIHGFITSNGQKMSKSLGNVVDPFEVVRQYGTDALRYWCAKEANTFEDSDFTWEKFKESYNADLANGLGNLVSRTLKMATAYGVRMPKDGDRDERPRSSIESFQIQKEAAEIWKKIKAFDLFIQNREPFKKIKTDPEAAKKDVEHLLIGLYDIAFQLQPFLPTTADKILSALSGDEVKEVGPLFPRMQ